MVKYMEQQVAEKHNFWLLIVIPAEAGIQGFKRVLRPTGMWEGSATQGAVAGMPAGACPRLQSGAGMTK
jgi:hypothetical protein